MKKYIWAIILLLAINLVSAATFECFDDGSMTVKGLVKKKQVFTKDSEGSSIKVPGKFTYDETDQVYNFYSEEAVFVSKSGARYSIESGKVKTSVNCPPFKFSCEIFNVTVDYCYNRDDLFTAKFMAHNFHFTKTEVLRFTKPYALKYEITTADNAKLVRSSKVLSPELKNITISSRKLNSGNKFVFQWPNADNVKKFVIRYDECENAKYNFYKSAECTEATSCTIDSDCFQDEFCEDWTCKKLDCTECQYVENHFCVDYACCSDDQCLKNEICQDNTCIQFDCNENETIYNHTCQMLECEENEFAANHTCNLLNCSEDEVAENHTCKKLSCSSFQKIQNHSCVSYFTYFFNKIFR